MHEVVFIWGVFTLPQLPQICTSYGKIALQAGCKLHFPIKIWKRFSLLRQVFMQEVTFQCASEAQVGVYVVGRHYCRRTKLKHGAKYKEIVHQRMV